MVMTAPVGFERETFKTLLESYLERVNQGSGDLLQRLRMKAWDHFLELGLPTRHQEAYRYIKLRQLFAQSYALAEPVSLSLEDFSAAIYPECRQSVLVFINGHFSPQLSCRQAISNRIVISTLQEASRTYGALLSNQWGQSLKEETDPFAALNGALHHQGAFVYIPPKTQVEAPIQILNIIQTDDRLCLLSPRVHLFVGAQAEVSILTSQKVLGSSGHFFNQVTELALEESARVHYTQILEGDHSQAWHLDAVRATLKRHAHLKTVCVTEGGMTVRHDYRVALMGENAEALLNGVWMLADKKENHTHILIDHQAPHCRSYQLFKGVLNDFSRSSFEGKIFVRQIAQKTEAFQLNKNLLLNDYAHADSKPNLEVLADDVKASHGATVGQLDPEQLFYLKTRGLSTKQAMNLLIYGFCEQILEMIPLPSLKETISQRCRSFYYE